MRTKGPEQCFYAICNVHLEGHPDKHKERLAQLVSTRKSVAARAKKSGEEAHVVIAGDFNSNMQPLKEILNDGLKVVFPESDGNLKGAVTWAEPNKPASVDQMLVGASVDVTQKRLVLSDEQEFLEVMQTGLPSEKHASDHLPLCCIVKPNGPPASTAPA